MHKLKCVAQHYDWGQQGSTSLVGQIVKANCGEVKDDLPYAEYWMGSHVNGPSKVILESQEINLKDYLGLGQNKDKDKDKDQDLPFLFKVLSIKDALSIQAHPDKEFAEFLHENDPLHYKDDNHKPELAIAISDNFKLFYGMISEEESIKLSLKLAYLVEQAIKTDKYQADPHTHTGLRKKLDLYKSQNEITDTISNLEWYKELIKNLVTLNESEVQILINLIKEDKLGDHYEKKFSSFLSLHKRFGYDRGIIFSLFMNYMELKKGDALFIGPNIPHAYIEGDCIECMANSDNVIRLGLTPKFVDTENFLKIIDKDFKSIISDSFIKIGDKIDDKQKVFKNDKFKEFKVIQISLKSEEYSYESLDHSILFIISGNLTITKCDVHTDNHLNDPDNNANSANKLIANQYESILIHKSTRVNFASQECEIFLATSNYLS